MASTNPAYVMAVSWASTFHGISRTRRIRHPRGPGIIAHADRRPSLFWSYLFSTSFWHINSKGAAVLLRTLPTRTQGHTITVWAIAFITIFCILQHVVKRVSRLHEAVFQNGPGSTLIIHSIQVACFITPPASVRRISFQMGNNATKLESPREVFVYYETVTQGVEDVEDKWSISLMPLTSNYRRVDFMWLQRNCHSGSLVFYSDDDARFAYLRSLLCRVILMRWCMQ
ncbi:hypothetical protein CPB86DRAFT_414862 [Serendipita vermifera]|nr:hypothetical protein CPB86DRAFT_414862 [Serendipita vermifera]